MATRRRPPQGPPPPAEGVIAYGPHDGQKLFHRSPSRIRVLACGRRWGKDRACVMDTMLTLVNLRDERIQRLTAGQPSQLVPLVHCWVVAPTYKLLQPHWREFLAFLPADLVNRANEADYFLELLGGDILIEFKSADDPQKLVGVGLDYLLATECGIIQDSVWYESLQATLRSPGRLGKAVLNGTPKGKRGFFWKFYLMGQDAANLRQVQSWNFSCYDNPFADKEGLDFDRLVTPDHTFRQEYMAEFLDDGAGVFRRVREAAGLGPADDIGDPNVGHQPSSPAPNTQTIIGCDWGRSADATCFTVLEVKTKRVLCIDRFTNIEFAIQQGRLKALYERYHATAIIAEANSFGTPVIEQLRRDGLPVQPFTTTNATKQVIIDGLALALEQGTVQILNDKTLINELIAYSSERLPSGLIRYGAPQGMHDDTIISLALALYGAGTSLLPYGWLRNDPEWVASVGKQTSKVKPDESDEERITRRLAARGIPRTPRLTQGAEVAPYTDLWVDTENPKALDATLLQMGAGLVQDGPGGYLQEGGHYVCRVFGDPGYVKYALEQQGYARVVEATAAEVRAVSSV